MSIKAKMLGLLRLFKKRPAPQFQFGYNTWEEAVLDSDGYDDPRVIKRAIHAMNLVKSGIEKQERDLRVFHEKTISEKLLSAFTVQAKELQVLDVGGALGSTYLDFKDEIPIKQWMIVEQPAYVDYGKEHLQDGVLSFHYTYKDLKPNVILLSGVLAYLGNPASVVSDLCKLGAKYIVVDRAHVGNQSRIAVQCTSKMTFPIRIPIHILKEDELLSYFKGYKKLLDLDRNADAQKGIYYVGWVLEKI